MTRIRAGAFAFVLVFASCTTSSGPTTITTLPGATTSPTPTPGTVLPTTAPEQTTPSTTGAVVEPTTTTAPPAVEVPWAEVGPGWVLALYDQTNALDPAPADTVAMLVGPGRGPIPVVTWPADGEFHPNHILDWSPNGRQALVRGTGRDSTTVVRLVDLAAGSDQPVAEIPYGVANTLDASFTGPTGENLVVMEQTLDGARLERRSPTGEMLSHLYEVPSGFLLPGASIGWVYGRDGTTIVVGEPFRLLVLENDGSFLRDLEAPHLECFPHAWWTDDSILAHCGESGFWEIPVDGSAPSKFTIVGAAALDAHREGELIALETIVGIDVVGADEELRPVEIEDEHDVLDLVGVAGGRLVLIRGRFWDPNAPAAGPLVSVEPTGENPATAIPLHDDQVGVVSAVAFPTPP